MYRVGSSVEQVFDVLTDEQLVAVHHDAGHLLIAAGAGTGKTSTLAARLAHLVRSGVAPERILLLTFSRRAAAELLHRAELLAGQDVAGSVWGGTFHSVANRLLRRYGRAIGVEPSFTVLDAGDTADLLALVRDEVTGADGTQRRRARKETLAEIMSRCVNARQPLAQVLTSAYPWCGHEADDIKATFTAYTSRKRQRQLLDYDDLLLLWWGLLRHDDTAAVLRERFDHILVDEYQDTNALQVDVLAGLLGAGARITAVGDDAQAIYSFRAATHVNIMEFPQRFGADVVALTRNHRSTPQVLATANAVIAHARHRHDKQLNSARSDGPRPVLVRCHDETSQAVATCERILRQREAGIALRQQAVLVRSGHHSDLLELELTARNIPFVKYGGLKFLEAAHVKDLVGALRLVVNPTDELAWVRLLNLLDGVGRVRARTITGAFLAAADPVAEAAGSALTAVAELAAALVDARSLPADRPGAAVERMRAWLEPTIVDRYADAAARLADLEQLQIAAALAPSLDRFLTELTLDPPAATGDLAGPPSLDDDVLTLSTIHSAKGGEWDVVHVLHLVDGNVPSDMATGDAESIEEERRLLYVALTRARTYLYAYAPLRYHHQHRGKRDKHGYAQLSRFLAPDVLATMDGELAGGSAGAHDGALDRVAAGADRLARLDAEVAALWG